LIYGGASGGLGGTVSASCLENGGMVTAIIPRKIGGGGKYVEESGALTIITTEDVNERIKKMHELADGFLALPGGTGTFEEVCLLRTTRI
jgi:predicted Rossmann-fold nucleotide-binding protein